MAKMSPPESLSKMKKTQRVHSTDLATYMTVSLFKSSPFSQYIKEAVATSILSPIWRYVWTGLDKLMFDDVNFTGRLGHWQFVSTLYSVLLKTEPNPINIFKLAIRNPNSSAHNVRTWIFTVVTRNIKSMSLFIHESLEFRLPSIIFISKTLESFTLCATIILDDFPSVHLPHLKSLALLNVKYSSDVFNRLLPGCPMLEDLHIVTDYDVTWGYNPVSLINLAIVFRSLTEEHKVDVKASSLRTLIILGKLSGDNCRIKAENLKVADINVSSNYMCPLLRVLQDVSHVQFLKLSEIKIKVFVSRVIYKLPEFWNLKGIELSSSFFDWDSMVKLIERSPNLEVIVLTKVKAVVISMTDLCMKRRLQSVPQCLKSSLKEFHFKGFKGMGPELDALTYIMENANVLKTVRLGLDIGLNLNMENSADLDAMLYKFQRASKSCKLYLN